VTAPTAPAALTSAPRDSATMLWREYKHTLRYPLILIASILTPVVLLLLFVYILGGPIGHGLGDAARGAPYVDFRAPGILMLTAAAGCSTTAINVSTDMTGGIADRFATMPVARGALLNGHIASNVLRTMVTTTFVTAVALLVGFRPHASAADWFAVAGIVAAFSFALAWLSAALGLGAKTVAGANSATLPILFLLPFLSSAFVPADSMPTGVRWFSANQPFTQVVDCLRALLTGAPVGDTAYLALAWCAAIALAGYWWAQATFRRGSR
jgi:ABC-2 type transport system permease protein